MLEWKLMEWLDTQTCIQIWTPKQLHDSLWNKCVPVCEFNFVLWISFTTVTCTVGWNSVSDCTLCCVMMTGLGWKVSIFTVMYNTAGEGMGVSHLAERYRVKSARHFSRLCLWIRKRAKRGFAISKSTSIKKCRTTRHCQDWRKKELQSDVCVFPTFATLSCW